MVNINFVLDKRGKPGTDPADLLPIHCQIRYKVNGKWEQMKFATGEKCAPKYFKGQRVYHSVNFARQVNDRLNEIGSNAERVYRDAVESGTMPTKAKFKERILNPVFSMKVERELVEDFRAFIGHHEAKGTKSTKAMKYTLTVLCEFSRATKFPLDYEGMTAYFHGKFVQFLKEKKGLKTNTIWSHVHRLRMFLNWTKKEGWNPYDRFLDGFKSPTERVQNIYLTAEDLERMAALELARRPGLAETRNWFLLACEVGLRCSDYPQVKRANIKEVPGGYDLVFRPNKTQKSSGKIVTVPLSKIAVSILLKYGFEMPKPISNQKFNKNLKALAGLAGIEKEISTHTARRTFATLRYLERHPVKSIMEITGHSTESEFYKYLCIEGEQNAGLFRERDQKYQTDVRGLLETKLKVA